MQKIAGYHYKKKLAGRSNFHSELSIQKSINTIKLYIETFATSTFIKICIIMIEVIMKGEQITNISNFQT